MKLIDNLIKLSFPVELPSGALVDIELRIIGEPDLANEVITEGLSSIASQVAIELCSVVQE